MEKGIIEGLRLYGEACSSVGNCGQCPIGVAKGLNISCPQFLKEHPEVAYGLLKEIKGQPHTYYNEFCTRFPDMHLSLDDVSDAFCRRAIFEGNFSCTNENCKECWGTTYVSDVEPNNESKPEDDILSLFESEGN